MLQLLHDEKCEKFGACPKPGAVLQYVHNFEKGEKNGGKAKGERSEREGKGKVERTITASDFVTWIVTQVGFEYQFPWIDTNSYF